MSSLSYQTAEESTKLDLENTIEVLIKQLQRGTQQSKVKRYPVNISISLSFFLSLSLSLAPSRCSEAPNSRR